MKLKFLGAAGTVTGSKYLIESNGKRILVDCGMFQGWKALRLQNWEKFPVDISSVSAVVLTHAHVDHSGYLPRLWKEGFRGPIYSSAGTRALCKVLLPDAGRLQEEQAEYSNRKGFSKHKPALPLYTERDAEDVLKLFKVIAFGVETVLADQFKVTLRSAGHIVGASSVHVADLKTSILFSGDLGRERDLVTLPPDTPMMADYLVVESTYGNRLHPLTDPVLQLGQAIHRTAARRGVVIIPAFSVGRTQAILYAIHLLKQKGKMEDIPVYLNSPMSINAMDIYCEFRKEHRLSEGDCKAMCTAAHYVRSVDESKALNRKHGPMVIISASGMATGGRVLHHIKQFAPNSKNLILFVGFQAGGTRGADLVHGSKTLKLLGEYVPINAEVENIDGLSAHADQSELLAWVGKMTKPPKRIFITHGEPEGAEGLAAVIEQRLQWPTEVPKQMDEREL